MKINQMQILEQHDQSSHAEDKKHIQRLEKELLNCSQEIDFLQDQLGARNAEVNYLEKHVDSLELKLEGMKDLQEEVFSLREELKRSNSIQFSLIQELDTKEIELQKSALSIEKLEESFSSITLESQFEVESMKLDMIALEQSFFEAKKIQYETLDENNRINKSIEELQVALQNAQKIIISLNEENRKLKEKLDIVNKNAKISSFQKDEYWLENKDRPQLETRSSLSGRGNNSSILEDNISTYEVPGPKGKLEMSQKIEEYERLIKKLKEELREEKLRAKEEAEDLVQEMAELRYQLTSSLEEECKRRASIEHASLQRIAELEALGLYSSGKHPGKKCVISGQQYCSPLPLYWVGKIYIGCLLLNPKESNGIVSGIALVEDEDSGLTFILYNSDSEKRRDPSRASREIVGLKHMNLRMKKGK
ncbi:hypothetical protein VNO78_23717 [Psophocarpus tetragonolobus]|uniref:Uncharacterized protein n=1 Tax=Psophocarpus tetragonolobus TaxID=3891 RepID=A0AAN9XE22_PSOTE